MSYEKLLVKLLLYFLLNSCVCLAQDTTKHHVKTSFDLIYTSKMLLNSNFSSSLNTKKSFQFGAPLSYVGLSSTWILLVNKKSFFEGGFPINGYFEYTQIIPRIITVNDSLSPKINGFNVGLTVAGFDLFPRMENFDFITSLGVNTGRVWLKGDSQTRQKNPYFSPMVVIIPRIIIQKVSIQFRFSYSYDITNKNWKRKGFAKDNLMKLDSFSSESFNFSLGIGFILGLKNEMTIH